MCGTFRHLFLCEGGITAYSHLVNKYYWVFGEESSALQFSSLNTLYPVWFMLNGNRVARTLEIHCLEDKKSVAVLTPVLGRHAVEPSGTASVTSATPGSPRSLRWVCVHHQRVRTVRRITVGAGGAQPSGGASRAPA